MARDFYPGMGQAVAERTILRRKSDGSWETWGDVARRVALGNSLLCHDPTEQPSEFEALHRHLANASILMSGRHLQHGDETQSERNAEVFLNCASASSSFLMFYLLTNGSGVGRCYDDDMMLVDWDNAPTVRCVLAQSHPDFDYSAHESARDARHKYGSGRDVLWFEVPDDREGWATALEMVEVAAFEKIHKDKLLVLDFSKVRPKGSPIGGMQNRPASGPVPLMNAFAKAMTIRGAGLDRWKQALYIDHYFAECVLVGGARRSARMATKTWRDRSVLEFIAVKRPIEYAGLGINDIGEVRRKKAPGVFLWSSNNSITVDAEFWRLTGLPRDHAEYHSPDAAHARNVFDLATRCAYADGTGEPGFINVDRLHQSTDGLAAMAKGEYVGSKKFQVRDDTYVYLDRLMRSARRKRAFMVPNPCSEIPLAVWGAFCCLSDVVPYHCDSLDDAEDAFRVAARALVRVNRMDSIYHKEVERTNRIGVGMTGIHEFAWKFFRLGFGDLINEETSAEFWATINRFRAAVQEAADEASDRYGMRRPFTYTTIKPAGTTSKLFGLTEGAHLPAMEFYLRWVQFREDDPLVDQYRDAGYPIRSLNQYQGTTIVGFPTSPLISTLGLGDRFVTAAQATPEEQYQWLTLLERYWIRGVGEDGNPLSDDRGNQVSYTLKYNPAKVSYLEFSETIRRFQPLVKCCSVMPQEDTSSYEYLPEESVTKAQHEAFAARIREAVAEDVDRVHVDCAGGACPVDFQKGAA